METKLDFIDFNNDGNLTSLNEKDESVEIYDYTYRIECANHEIDYFGHKPKSCVGIVIDPVRADKELFNSIVIGFVEDKGSGAAAYYRETKMLKFHLVQSAYIPIITGLMQGRKFRAKLRYKAEYPFLVWAIIEFWDEVKTSA